MSLNMVHGLVILWSARRAPSQFRKNAKLAQQKQAPSGKGVVFRDSVRILREFFLL
jgi:hypothetical protein